MTACVREANGFDACVKAEGAGAQRTVARDLTLLLSETLAPQGKFNGFADIHLASPPNNAAPWVTRKPSSHRTALRCGRRLDATKRMQYGQRNRPSRPAHFKRGEEKNGFGRRCQRPQGLRRRRGDSWGLHLDQGRRIRDFGRALGLRKIDAPAHDRGPGGDRGRKDPNWEARRQQSRPEGPRHCNGLSKLCPLSAQDGSAEHELRFETTAHSEGGDRGPRPARCRDLAY